MLQKVKQPRWLWLVVVVLLVAGAATSMTATVDADPSLKGYEANIDGFILDELATQPRTDVFVKLADNADLTAAAAIADRVQRLNNVHDTLTAQASQSQAALLRWLDQQGIRYQSYWINNSVLVYDADLALAQALAARSDVAYVRGNRPVEMIWPVSQEPAPAAAEAIEWGVQKIRANLVWPTGNTGQGIVVSSIDSGTRYTHNALIGKYRGNNGDGTFTHDYNWYDPSFTYAVPTDPLGHGTHTMGTMVGDDGGSNQVGVAPGAKWMTAGLGTIPTDSELIAAAQWILCPTRVNGSDPNCAMAPHVVNNSWGGGGGDSWYQSYVNAWVAAGIIPVFSLGNSGSSCNTAGSPGDYANVFGIGATNSSDLLASFSSKGPGQFRLLKPDFVAPGENVRSSVNSSDSAYGIYSGTSMAAPHMVGTIALMLSAQPNLTMGQIYGVLAYTSQRNLGAPPGPDTCLRPYNQYPNPIHGFGQIDAYAAVDFVNGP